MNQYEVGAGGARGWYWGCYQERGPQARAHHFETHSGFLVGPHPASLSLFSRYPQHDSPSPAEPSPREPPVALPEEPKFDMLYKIEDVPPWYLCILLGFQVGSLLVFPTSTLCAPQDPSPCPGHQGYLG